MYTGNNPSALRSQDLLSQALLNLMQRFPYSEITITMLCSQAGVSRQTFYKLFDSKDDIIRSVAKTRCLAFELNMIKQSSMTLQELAESTFAFVKENNDLIKHLISNQLEYLLQEQAQLALIALFRCFRCDEDGVLDDTNCCFIAGGLCALLVSWATSEHPFNVEDYAKSLTRLFSFSSFVRIENESTSITKLLSEQ